MLDVGCAVHVEEWDGLVGGPLGSPGLAAGQRSADGGCGMTARRRRVGSKHASEHIGRRDAGAHAGGLATFSDAASLIERLESRSAERRGGERRGASRGLGDRRFPAQRRVAGCVAAARLGERELCHDMRQPLSAILALTVGLEEAPSTSPALRSQLQLLEQEARRLSEYITNFLDRPAQSWVDLGTLIGEVCASIGLTASGADVAVHAERGVIVHGDATMLYRAVMNAADNACRAAGQGGRVRLRLATQEDMACLEIDDDGPGLGGDTPTGYGMGSSITTLVIASSGGMVENQRSDLGGLCVRMYLPLARPSLNAVANL